MASQLANLVDGVQDVLGEPSHVGSILGRAGPLLLLGAVVPVSPQVLHQLRLLDLELGRVHLGELLQGEGPAVKSRAETHGSLVRRDLL